MAKEQTKTESRKTLRNYVEASTQSAIGKFFPDEKGEPYEVLDCEAYKVSIIFGWMPALFLDIRYLDGRLEKKRFGYLGEIQFLNQLELTPEEVRRAKKESGLVEKAKGTGTGKAPIVA